MRVPEENTIIPGLQTFRQGIVALRHLRIALILKQNPAGERADGACFHKPAERQPGNDNKSVTDQLFLSIWLDRNGRAERTRQFEKLLRHFPFSQREQPQSTLSILAVNSTEPPLLERPVNGPIDVEDVLSSLGDYSGDDIAFELESWWDLWTYDGDWRLAPARILLSCFGPSYDGGTEGQDGEQEDLRIDFGVDSHYLPDPDIPGGGKLIESNVKSLLRLVHELDSALDVKRRKLQTESGTNFADRLQQVLSVTGRIQ